MCGLTLPAPSWQDDEDITSLDMTILMACKQKVNQSYIMIIVATFDELMLRHDVCSLSFSEIHTWIKKSARHTWKAWRTKEVDWGPCPSVPNVLHQAITSILAQGKKEIKSNTFQCWIRTTGQWQFVTDATTSYGLHFGRSSTSWKAYEIYFQKDPASCPYLLGVSCSHRFTTETFSVHGAESPDLKCS